MDLFRHKQLRLHIADLLSKARNEIYTELQKFIDEWEKAIESEERNKNLQKKEEEYISAVELINKYSIDLHPGTVSELFKILPEGDRKKSGRSWLAKPSVFFEIIKTNKHLYPKAFNKINAKGIYGELLPL